MVKDIRFVQAKQVNIYQLSQITYETTNINDEAQVENKASKLKSNKLTGEGRGDDIKSCKANKKQKKNTMNRLKNRTSQRTPNGHPLNKGIVYGQESNEGVEDLSIKKKDNFEKFKY